MGRFEDGESKVTLDAGDRRLPPRERRQRAGPGQGRQRRRAADRVRHTTASTFDDIDVFYLAGGFGRHLRLDAAQRIGLIPNIADAKIVQVGNAAIEGATLALLSRAKRAELEATGAARRALPAGDAPAASSTSSSRAASSSRVRVRARRRRRRMIELVDDVRPAVQRRSGGVRAAARLSARASPRRPGRGAGRRGRGLVRRARPAVDLRPRGVDADARRRRRAHRRRAVSPAPRLRQSLVDAGAHRAVLVAVGAGPELEAEAARRWQRREARRVLLPRGLRLGRRRAPGDAGRRPPVRLGRGAGAGGAAALQPGLSGVGHRRAAALHALLNGVRGAAARPARGARLGHAAAEEIAARRVRPDPPRRAARAPARPGARASAARFAPCQYRRAPYRRGAPRSTARAFDEPTGADDAAGDDADAPRRPGPSAAYTRQREGAAPLGAPSG